MKFTEKHWQEIAKAFEESPVWVELNKKVGGLYEKFNRLPSDEEYQAVRTAIMCKTILEDDKVMQTMAKCTWEVLQKGE